MTWTGFAGVFAAFFITHSIPVRPAVKARLSGAIGPRGFTLAYSALSLAMLSLLIWSAREAPYVQLWPQMMWQRHMVHLGMLVVCLILAVCIARPNPFSFGGARTDCYDPQSPGITHLTRHPVLLALALWAGLHLLPNGDLAHVILFSVLGAFAVAGSSLIDRRKRRLLGAQEWKALDAARRNAPWINAPSSWTGLAMRLSAGVLAFAVLLSAHPYVIGVSAF